MSATTPENVEAMAGSDWMLLEFEAPDTPMHTLKIVVLDSAARGRPVDLAEIARVVPLYVGLSAHFTSRVEKRSGRWCWVQDSSFDVWQHLDERTLSDPGGLDDLCSELSQRQLDRSLPLWRITLVHGLARGRQAVVVQPHHALMDGSSAAHLFSRVTSPEPGVAPAPVVSASLKGFPPRPSLARRLYAVGVAAADVRKKTKEFGPSPLVPKGMFKRSPLNLPSAGGRLCALAELPLPALMELAKLNDTSINGALHGVLALAMRRQFLADGHRPRRPIVGSFGVIEDRSVERFSLNNLATARYWLHVEDDQPLRALRRTGESCAQTVAFRRARGFRLQTLAAEFGRFIPPLRNRFVRLWPLTPIHLLTAYVSGPREKRWLGDVAVESWFSVAVSVELTNVDVVGYTYADKMALGLITTPESLPDPQGFLRRCSQALEDLITMSREASENGQIAGSRPPAS